MKNLVNLDNILVDFFRARLNVELNRPFIFYPRARGISAYKRKNLMTDTGTLSLSETIDCTLSPSTEDRRRATRTISVLMNAKVSTDRKEGICRILNIARRGLNIESSLQLKVGNQIRIELRSDLSVDGRVRWENCGIAGIELAKPIALDALLKRPAFQIERIKSRQPRFRCTAIASIKSRGKTLHCTVADISIRGARLEGVDKLRPGEIVPLQIEHLTPHKVTVIWSGNCQAGVRLVNILSYSEMELWLRDHGSGITGAPC